MRRKLNIGFLTIIVLIGMICTYVVLSNMKVQKTFAILQDSVIPDVIAINEMKYTASEIRMWTLTYIVRGNVTRDGKTIREWLQGQWLSLEENTGKHFQYGHHSDFGRIREIEKIADLSQKLISVSAEIIDLKDQGAGNDELFDKVKKDFGHPIFYPLRKALNEHAAVYFEKLSAAETEVYNEHRDNIRYVLIICFILAILTMFIGILVDRLFVGYITKRKQAEEALCESEKKFKAMVETAPSLLIITDSNGYNEYISPNCEEFTGYSREELIGKMIWWVHEDNSQEVKEVFKRTIREGIEYRDFEYKAARKNGEIWHASSSWKPLRDETGQFKGVVFQTIDITKRKQAEDKLVQAHDSLEVRVRERTEELTRANKLLREKIVEHKQAKDSLRKSEQKVRAVLNQTFQFMGLIALDGTLMEVNETALEFAGIKEKDVLGKAFWETIWWTHSAELQDKLHNAVKKAANGQLMRFEVTHPDINGTLHYVDFSLKAAKNESGEIKYLIAEGRDINESKLALKQKLELQSQLELARKMESIGLLAGGVAHDLNNLLGPMVGYPELILSKLPDDSPHRKNLIRIANSAEKASEIVQDLLALARRGRYTMKSLSLNHIIEEYLDLPAFIELNADNPNVSVEKRLDNSIPKIFGSPSHLLKVVMNLIVNAFDAMSDGGKLTITTSCSHLKELKNGYDGIEENDYVLLKIQDTGEGIDEKNMERIFEPYYSSKDIGRSGSGLGLSVVYGIIKDHNGYYDVVSQVGKGTEFILYFPILNSTVDFNSKTQRISIMPEN